MTDNRSSRDLAQDENSWHRGELKEPLGTGLTPHQFGISDLLALTTACAILFALVVPAGLQFASNQGSVALIMILIQITLSVGFFLMAIRSRSRILDRAGSKLGSGYCGDCSWSWWPRFQSWLAMLAIAVAQLLVALIIVRFGMTVASIQLWILLVQMCFFAARSVFVWWEGVYPNGVEFFERGVVFGGVVLLDWGLAEVRPSKLFHDRIVLAIKPTADSTAFNLKVVQLTPELKQRLLATFSSPVVDATIAS